MPGERERKKRNDVERQMYGALVSLGSEESRSVLIIVSFNIENKHPSVLLIY